MESHESACEKAVLALACGRGDINLIKYLIRHPQYKNEVGAVQFAVFNNITIVEMLLGYMNDFHNAFCYAA